MLKTPAKNRAIFKKLFCSALILSVLSAVTVSAAPATAVDSPDDVPYASYTYWSGTTVKKAVPAMPVYLPEGTVDGETLGCGVFTNPQDICTDRDGRFLYILDSGASRILKVTLNDYKISEIITDLTYNGEKISFQNARGIYVNRNGHIYIADSENARILILDSKHSVTEIIKCPESILIPKDFHFFPIRMAEDEKGYLYILSEGCYYGALVLDNKLDFCGFYGANIVESSFFGALKGLITSVFETDAKREGSLQRLPSDFVDIDITDDGFLCTVSTAAEGQLRKLSPKGNNNLRFFDKTGVKNADSFMFGDYPQDFWRLGKEISQSFSGICIDNDGFFYLSDSSRGRIYMYDSRCRLLGIFGGGMGNGEQTGTFKTAFSVAAAHGRVYVLDFIKCNVTVFSETEYGALVKSADLLTLAGKHLQAEPLWQKVMALDKFNQTAYNGLAKAAIAREDYSTAMKYSKNGLDRATYKQAFEIVFRQRTSEHFPLIMLVFVVVLGGILAFVIYTTKKEVVLIKNETLRLALTSWIHPFRCIQSVKAKNKCSISIAVILYVLFYAGKAAEILLGGFMYIGDKKESFNAVYTLLGSIGIVILYVVVNWAACILIDGKGKFKEIFCVTGYSLIPLIIYSVMFSVLSHFLVDSAFSFLTVLQWTATLWTLLLLLLGMMIIHEFDFFKALKGIVLTIFGMFLAAFLIFIVFMLTQDFIGFIVGLIREATLR